MVRLIRQLAADPGEDELIRSLDQARTEFVRLEERTDEEIGEVEEGFSKLRADLQEDD